MSQQSNLPFFDIPLDDRLRISFQRTLRTPEDDRDYPLPASLGPFPIYRAAQYLGAPREWREAGDYFFPMYRREAMWIGMRPEAEEPAALQIGVGDRNALTGEEWNISLQASPQNYLVCPVQPWLDGFNAGGGVIRQFVAVPLGTGESAEAQLQHGQESGGLRFAAFAPKPGARQLFPAHDHRGSPAAQASSMALAPGGRIQQKIYPDPWGLKLWKEQPAAVTRVRIISSLDFRALTGEEPPPTLVTAEQYTKHGLPWFALYDEDSPTLAASSSLANLKPLSELDRERGTPPDTSSLDIPDDQIQKLHHQN